MEREEAIRLFLLAVNQGSPEAQYLLVKFFENDPDICQYFLEKLKRRAWWDNKINIQDIY
jgi:TPR repeat protein